MAYVESITRRNETRTIRDLNGQQMLATVEASTTASKAYAVGDYLILNDKLYKVTTAIASGGTITVGTNVAEAKVGTELTDLNRQISDSTTGLDGKAPVIVNTASGEIASFADGADGMPVKSLIANIEPVQDLHGYANPWPAGGGVNQWDEDWENAYYNDQGVKVTSTDLIGSKNLISVTPGQEVYLVCPYGITLTIARFNSSKTFISRTQGLTGSYTIPDGCYYISFSTNISYGSTYQNNIAINYPATVTTYSPHSNICPISGHTGASVTRTGVNILDSSHPDYAGTLIGTDGTSSTNSNFNTWEFKKQGTYTVAIDITETINSGRVVEFNSGGSVRAATGFNVTVGRSSLTFTLASGEKALVSIRKSAESLQAEVGGTASSYEAYRGNTYPITFPSEAGTVYGGTLDVVSGVLTVNRLEQIYNGSETWNYSPTWSTGENSNAFYIPTPLNNAKYNSVDEAYIICDRLSVKTRNELYNSDTPYDIGYSGPVYDFPLISVRMPKTITTPAELQTWLSSNNVKMVYELETPVIYQLTPQQINTLLGQNNIYSDVGSIADVQYPADTKLYIEQLTKPTEDDMTANANIAANKFFMIGNTLYFSTTAIAQGATIIPGTNCNVISLADALNNLNS